MPNLQNTDLLDNLLHYALRLGGQEALTVTAERFLLAVIDVLQGRTPFEATPKERENLIRLMDAYPPIRILGVHDVRTILTAGLDTSDPRESAAYMCERLDAARQAAAAGGMDALTAELLLAAILEHPSDFLRMVSEKAEAKGAGTSFRSRKGTDPAEGDEPIGRPGHKKETGAANATDGDEPILRRKPGTVTETETGTGTTPPADKKEEPAAAPDAPQGDGRKTVETLTAEAGRIRDEIRSVLFGQDKAVSMVVSGNFHGELMRLTEPENQRPRAVFLLAGPPGVGKTYLAHVAAQSITGMPVKRFDMSEYSDKEANLEFAGMDAAYKSAKQGNVTSYVKENPRCVLLFDEIEKAHLNVIYLFLQILDRGKLRDNFTDEEVSFKETIIFFTTNAGHNLYEEAEGDDFSGCSRKVILKALEKDVNPLTKEPFFPAALCSRFATGNVVMMNRISAHALQKIAQKNVLQHAKQFEERIGFAVDVDPMVYAALLFAEGAGVDARTISARSAAFVDDELLELFRLLGAEGSGLKASDLEEIRFRVRLPEDAPEITELFTLPKEKRSALVFSDDVVYRTCASLCGGAVTLRHASSAEEGRRILREDDVGFVLLDIRLGRDPAADYLNPEDIPSEARTFLRLLQEEYVKLPVYLLNPGEEPLNAEQQLSFLNQGVRGVLPLDDGASLTREIDEICEALHRQAGLRSLARANRLVQFETAQRIADGKTAEIVLFDFRMVTAVDAQDTKNILSSLSKPEETFDQVVGAKDAKEELQFYVDYLKNPKKYAGRGMHAPRGVLLYGPPGTGKTMLAKAMANASDVTFINTEGNEFIKGIVGESGEAVRKMFMTARKYAPAILFVDEIDAFAKQRGEATASEASANVLTAFLAQMDGFKNNDEAPVFVLAATNYGVEDNGAGKTLDPALLRRFDRRIFVDLPGKEDRINFLRGMLAKNKMFRVSEAELANIGIRSTGMSLALLRGVAELALRSAVRGDKEFIDDDAFEEAFETFTGGEAKKWDASTLERVARHEAGHAYLCWAAGEKPSYVTIVARGDHGGYMQHGDSEGRGLRTRAQVKNLIRTSLGGRAAELVYYGQEDGVSTGASGDLASATYYARLMLNAYGMDGEFGLATQGRLPETMEPAERDAVNRILREELEQAVALISAARKKTDRLVEALLERDHLTGEEIDSIFGAP